MSDDQRLADPIVATYQLPKGSTIIFRHYNSPVRAVLAHKLQRACRRRGLFLLIADDARLARRVHADGLHLPEPRLRRGPSRWRLLIKRGWIITGSAHSRAALARAVAAGCQTILMSPVFVTASHPHARPLGVLKLARSVKDSPVPLFALGGIIAPRLRRLASTGICGMAGISGLSAQP